MRNHFLLQRKLHLMDDLTLLSATRLAQLIRNQEVTSRLVVDAHISKIQAVNPTINAVVRDRFDDARAEAQAADDLVRTCAADELPVFHGVPCTIKECFAVEGMPQTGGVVARSHVVATKDAITVQRLRDAGAIPLGITNLSEGCMWLESSNKVYGRTNNPYDPTRMVGGSSGGEGAIVGAGASPFGLGSDIGGSIRLPAFFNGVFGHKPSSGLVPSTGQWPIAENEAMRFLCTGPLTRRAEDLWPLLQVLRGPDGVDPVAQTMQLGHPDEVDVSKLNIIYVPDNGTSITAELSAAHRAAVTALQNMGATVRELRIDRFKKSFDIWSQLLGSAGDTPFRDLIGKDGPVPLGREFLKFMLRRSNHTLPALGLAFLEGLSFIVPDDPAPMVALANELRAELEQEIGPNGVMLFPTFSRPAPRHNYAMLVPFHAAYTAIFNVLEMPATAVPLGLSATKGVPLGLQVVGNHGQDHLTIATALALEKALGGWIPPQTRNLKCP
jgi:fatty acid amide hydrolase 2